MQKGESVISYLTKIKEVHDELAAVGEKLMDTELVCVALNGFIIDWHTFVQSIIGFIQQSLRMSAC